MEPVSSVITTASCPDLWSLPACNCHVTTKSDPTHFTPSGNYLTISCGIWTGLNRGTMTDADAGTLVGLIQPTHPVEAIGFYYQTLTKVPPNLKQFTYLKSISLQGNRITSANAADLTWSTLIEIQLQSNAITTISGNFALTNPFLATGSSTVWFDVSNNQIASLSGVTFTMTADQITLHLGVNSITSISSSTFTFNSTQYIYLNCSSNQITSLSGSFNLTTTDAT